MSNNAHELSNRLLNALDNNYNVVDMHAVNEIISILEKINITKELLETTRLGKHVNELRRKTSEPTLARRAKVLVKRWRDLVIPAAASPQNTGSNRSSAERQTRRLGGTPITSPAFARQVVSPAVPSPRPPSRPTWGGYESDSQDVILVDDDPPPPPPPPPPPATVTVAAPSPLAAAHKPIDSPTKRPPSPEAPNDDKKAKRDKKPKKRRGHSRAGSGAETAGAGAAGWAARNGQHAHAHAHGHGHAHAHAHAHPAKKNGVRSGLDPYAALVNRMPPAGAKKVKTTKELLAQIQSRGAAPSARSPSPSPSPASPASPDVMLIEPDEPCPVKPGSPLRNGAPSPSPRPPSPPPPAPPLEDPREHRACTCGEEPEPECPAARRREVLPVHVHALHHAYLPGVNGTRAPLYPHQFAVRKLTDPDRPDLFTTVVPLYNYSDYADDYCVKNMSRVPLCPHLPWTEFAPPPPEPEPAPEPPPPRPYPVDDGAAGAVVETEPVDDDAAEAVVEPEPVDDEGKEPMETGESEVCGEPAPAPEPSERLRPPVEAVEEGTPFVKKCDGVKCEVADSFAREPQEHRTVERTKPRDGRELAAACGAARAAVPFHYGQVFAAPTVTLPEEGEEGEEGEGGVRGALEAALARAAAATERDDRGRPARAPHFAEWHECARLGELVALPYVVID